MKRENLLAKKESNGKRNERWRFQEGRDCRRYRDGISYISSLPFFIVKLLYRLAVALSLGEQNIELSCPAASAQRRIEFRIAFTDPGGPQGDNCSDLLHGSLLHAKRAILINANRKPLGKDFISPVFDRGGGQRNKVAVLGLLVFAVPPILTFIYISPIL